MQPRYVCEATAYQFMLCFLVQFIQSQELNTLRMVAIKYNTPSQPVGYFVSDPFSRRVLSFVQCTGYGTATELPLVSQKQRRQEEKRSEKREKKNKERRERIERGDGGRERESQSS